MSSNHHTPQGAPSAECARFAPLLPIAADLEAGAPDVTRLREHVSTCAHCQEEVATYSQLDASLRRYVGLEATPRLATADIVWSITGVDKEESSMRDTASQRPSTMPERPPTLSLHLVHPTRPPDIHHPARGVRRVLSAAAAIAALLVLAVLAQALFALHGRSTLPGAGEPTPTPVAQDPLVIGTGPAITCAIGAIWSPDGARVAVVGYKACPIPSPQGLKTGGGTLAVYDSRTGYALQSVDLDAAVIAQVVPPSERSDPAKLSHVAIVYENPLWSPDGRLLALAFIEQLWAQGFTQSSGDPHQGLIIVQTATGITRVLDSPPLPYSIGPATSFAPARVIRWDLASGTATTVQIPQALSYAWGQDGTLVPVQPLPSSPDEAPPAVAPGPVGNPDGGKTFTIWQTVAIVVNRDCPIPGQPSTPQPPYFQVSAFLSTWSPDGRYLIGQEYVVGRLAQQPSAASVGGAGAAHTAGAGAPAIRPLSCGGPIPPSSDFAQLPVRDAGMRTALAEFTNYVTSNNSVLYLAWSPNGERLAAGTGTAQSHIVITDTRTGAVLARFATDADQFESATGTARTQPGNLAFLSQNLGGWSPDSKRLLLVDQINGDLVILGGKELGG